MVLLTGYVQRALQDTMAPWTLGYNSNVISDLG